jgi:hypothetical protein
MGPNVRYIIYRWALVIGFEETYQKRFIRVICRSLAVEMQLSPTKPIINCTFTTYYH